MSSNLSRRALLNVPSPNPERGAYARFIPREELGDFASWSPDSFALDHARTRNRQRSEPRADPAPPGPSAEQWQAQVDAARQSGYEDGYRDGLVALDGFKKSHAEQVNQQVHRFLQALDAEFDTLHEQLSASVVRVALQLARQVLRDELVSAPEHVARVAAEALESVLLSARHITVQVHPLDLPLVAAGAQEVVQARGARLIATSGIERGGCRVESDMGAIDAGIASRWAQATQALGGDEAWVDDGAAN